MKLHEVIEEVVKGKGAVFASATIKLDGSSSHEGIYYIRYSDGGRDCAPTPELAPKLVFCKDNVCLPTIPINVDWNLHVSDR